MKYVTVLLLAAIILAGCNQPAQTTPQQIQTYLMANNAFTALVQELTLLQKGGAFNQSQIDNMTVLIHSGQTCLNQWKDSLENPSLPAYNGYDCMNTILTQLLAYANEGNKI
jgi:hypothetical protein